MRIPRTPALTSWSACCFPLADESMRPLDRDLRFPRFFPFFGRPPAEVLGWLSPRNSCATLCTSLEDAVT